MARGKTPAQPLRIRAEYVIRDGQLTEFDPSQTNLPDRCKLALAEMTTGQPHKIVNTVTR